jgi:hypothetical protein
MSVAECELFSLFIAFAILVLSWNEADVTQRKNMRICFVSQLQLEAVDDIRRPRYILRISNFCNVVP